MASKTIHPEKDMKPLFHIPQVDMLYTSLDSPFHYLNHSKTRIFRLNIESSGFHNLSSTVFEKTVQYEIFPEKSTGLWHLNLIFLAAKFLIDLYISLTHILTDSYGFWETNPFGIL